MIKGSFNCNKVKLKKLLTFKLFPFLILPSDNFLNKNFTIRKGKKSAKLKLNKNIYKLNSRIEQIFPNKRIFNFNKGHVYLFCRWFLRYASPYVVPREVVFTKIRSRLIHLKIRLLAFYTAFTSDGKKLKAQILINKVLFLIRAKIKTHHALVLLGICFEVLEPSFYLKTIVRGRKIFTIPVASTVKKRAFMAMKFFSEGVLEYRKTTTSNLSVLLAEEVILLLRFRWSEKKENYVCKARSYAIKLRYMDLLMQYRFDCRFLKIDADRIVI